MIHQRSVLGWLIGAGLGVVVGVLGAGFGAMLVGAVNDKRLVTRR